MATFAFQAMDGLLGRPMIVPVNPDTLTPNICRGEDYSGGEWEGVDETIAEVWGGEEIASDEGYDWYEEVFYAAV